MSTPLLYLRQSSRLLRSVSWLGFASGAALFAYLGFARYHQDRENFDQAALWLGLSLLCLAALAWRGPLPRPTLAWPNVIVLLREHWWEVALLSAIVGFGAFLRLYTFGDYPVSGVVFEEENITARFGWQILHGERPLDLPLSRYGVALGFLLFGENTMGLRLPFVLASIATVLFFYLLARELVRPPAALLVTALAASASLLMDPMQEMQSGLFAMTLFLYLLIRGMRTGAPLLLLGAGALGGVLSYEWDGLKPIPLIAVGYVGALTVRRLAWPPPTHASALLERAHDLLRSYGRLLLVAFGAAAVVLVPMIVAHLQGENVYFESLERHRQEAQSTGLPIFIAPDWEQRLKWAGELFLPFGPQTFPGTPLSTGLRLVDVVTGVLVTLAVPYALLTAGRPYRALFLVSYLVGLVGAALLRDPFVAWDFIPLLPLGLVLAAFLVDDGIAALRRLAPRASAYVTPVILIGAALYASASNAQALLGTIVDDPTLPRAYSGHRPERGYVLCDYLRGQGRENFSYILFSDPMVGAFAGPTRTVGERLAAFGEHAWVCGGLRGSAVAAAEEAWPLQPAPAGPATLAFITTPEAVDQIVAAVRRALPGKPRPDRVIEKPATNYGPFALVGYELSAEEVRQLQGLHARYQTLDGRLVEERVDDVATLRWGAENTPALPFTVRWRGVVRLQRPATASLVADADDPTEVRVDGSVSFSSLGGAFPRALLPGWHPVEVTMTKRTPGGSFSFRWVDDQGRTLQPLQASDLFPLPSLRGWRHRRTLAFPSAPEGTLVTERFDFQPYLALHWLVRVRTVTDEGLPASGVYDVRVIREEWSAVWRVAAERVYKLQAWVGGGSLVVMLDGAAVLELPAENAAVQSTAPRAAIVVQLRVSAGEHRIDVVQTPRDIPDGDFSTGAILSISDPGDPLFAPDLSPF